MRPEPDPPLLPLLPPLFGALVGVFPPAADLLGGVWMGVFDFRSVIGLITRPPPPLLPLLLPDGGGVGTPGCFSCTRTMILVADP